MSDEERRQKGLAKFKEVYGNNVPAPPAGASDFFDTMIKQVFAEVWTRGELSQRDRRLVIMGAIAAMGEHETFGLQVRSAISAGELTPAQVREMLIQLAQYVGYPRVAGILPLTEKVLTEMSEA